MCEDNDEDKDVEEGEEGGDCAEREGVTLQAPGAGDEEEGRVDQEEVDVENELAVVGEEEVR